MQEVETYEKKEEHIDKLPHLIGMIFTIIIGAVMFVYMINVTSFWSKTIYFCFGMLFWVISVIPAKVILRKD